MLVVYVLNVARVAGLALNHVYWRPTVAFNHHYTFTLVVYAAQPAVLVPAHGSR